MVRTSSCSVSGVSSKIADEENLDQDATTPSAPIHTYHTITTDSQQDVLTANDTLSVENLNSKRMRCDPLTAPESGSALGPTAEPESEHQPHWQAPVHTLAVERPLGLVGATNANGAQVNGKTFIKPLPVEYYNSFLSERAKRRKPNSIRELLPLELTPGVISLLAGKPNSLSFPISSVAIDVRSASDPSDAQGTILNIDTHALAEGLQYGVTDGYKPLLGWLKGLQAFFHGRKDGEGWRLTMACGSQDALYKAFNAIISPGDAILVESPVYAYVHLTHHPPSFDVSDANYSGILPILYELQADIIPIESDADGIRSSVLHDILGNWPSSKVRPKGLYTVPYGSNPAGMTTSESRRREILALAVQFNFLIFEDDPYYYLYYDERPRPKSYFALELEQAGVGRVMRFDSMSKILSAGMRIGFASGPASLIDAMDMHTAMANMQVPSFTQVITYAILESWGYGKFQVHTEVLSKTYRKRRDIFDAALHSTLDGLAEWKPPVSGLFFWFRLLINGGNEDSVEIIRNRAFKKGVLAMPGAPFMPDGKCSPYVRASFSLLEPDEVYEALRRLREVLLEVQAQAAR